jgi:hypothetical protein
VISEEIIREARADHPVTANRSQPASTMLFASRKSESAVMNTFPYV